MAWPPQTHQDVQDAVTGLQARPTTARVAGTLIGWAGDSITAGTGASNGSVTSFRVQAQKIAGARISVSSINGGVAGENSTQILARIDGIITAGAQFLVVLAGTNDAGQSVPLATYQSNIKAIKAKADAAGLPIVFGLVPPRASTQGATIAGFARQYNMWLRFWGASVGVPIVDTFKALADPTTGYLLAARDSGDGIHPSDAGHLALAVTFAAVLQSLLPLPVWPVAAAGQGYVPDPLNVSTSSWGVWAGPQFAAQSLIPAANGDLPAGQWQRLSLSNGAATGISTLGVVLGNGWTAGDQLMVCMYFRGSATGVDGSKVQLIDQNSVVLSVLFDQMPVAAPGPAVALYTVAAGITSLSLEVVIKCRANTTDTVDFGAYDVFNLTQLGLAGTIRP